MHLNIVGTLPYQTFPFTTAVCSYRKGQVFVGQEAIPVMRGTPALIAAACIASERLGAGSPKAFLAGDIGHGDGSSLIYAHLEKDFPEAKDQVFVFHYLQPDVDWHNRILIRIDGLESRPILIADAGYMYVAKMSGFAASYDLFTPDAGELAFLADETAPHPFYTRNFLLQDEKAVPDLIKRAYQNDNASRFLLVKGKRDVVASQEGILGDISEPSIENMEPIGGTGDTLTGIVSALVAAEMPIPKAALNGALVNRYLGLLSNPTPASRVSDLLSQLPTAIDRVLSQTGN